jgi:hypothetical protein
VFLVRDHQQDLRIANATQGSVLQQNPNATHAEIDDMAFSSLVLFPDPSYSLHGQLIPTIFEGAFLQPGPYAIWGIFLFIGIYSILLIRAYQVWLFFIMVFCVHISCHAHLISPEG